MGKRKKTADSNEYVSNFKKKFIQELQDQCFEVRLGAPPKDGREYAVSVVKCYFVPGEKYRRKLEVIEPSKYYWATSKVYVEFLPLEDVKDDTRMITVRVSFVMVDWKELMWRIVGGVLASGLVYSLWRTMDSLPLS
jgi:hypothetical protein